MNLSSSSRTQSTKATLSRKPSQGSSTAANLSRKPSQGSSTAAKGVDKGGEKATNRAPKKYYRDSQPYRVPSHHNHLHLNSSASDTSVASKSKVPKTESSHKSASESRLSSKLNFLRASLNTGAHRGRDLGNNSSSESLRGSQSSQAQRGDQPKPDGSRRSHRTSEATGSCASNR